MYPFSAVVGQEGPKRALLLNLVDPSLGGVLLCGQKGTSKSTLARSVKQLCPTLPFVELPLNVTEDRLLGGIDLSKAVSQGAICQGTIPQGAICQGTVSQGTVSQGAIRQGTVSQGTIPQGAIRQGTVSQGTDCQEAVHQASARQGSSLQDPYQL